jgi:hypothetical protein
MPRRLKCCYREGSRKCTRDGTGNPPLCKPHQIAVTEAARPRRPAEILADTIVDFMQGRPINAGAAVGALDTLLGGMGQDYRPDAFPGQSENDVHQRAQQGRQAPGWWNAARQRASQHVDPAEAEARARQLAARKVMGFTATEELTEEIIRDRRKRLARKHHADAGGTDGRGSRMAQINAATDVLLQALHGADR